MSDYTFHSDIGNLLLVEKWIIDSRPLPDFQTFSDELVLAVAHWCIDPQSLLNLSTTCKNLARILRTVSCWLDHHWGRGYDIGVLAKKVKHAAAAPEKPFGPDGWGVLVKSAFDKAEFPDDEHLTQWNMGKPLPHLATVRLNLDPDAVEKYQPRGERWMRVLYDVLTEHEQHNMKLYPWLADEALNIRVKGEKYRYFQALISASDLLTRMWTNAVAATVNQGSVQRAQMSLDEIPEHDHRRTTFSSLTWTFLVANKIMQIDPAAQVQRRLYPHPPFGPSIWEGPNGQIDPDGLGWISKVRDSWKGRVYVMGQWAKITSDPSPYAIPRLPEGPPIRMCLDFQLDGQITGRGRDSGGRFQITSGSYRKTFVELCKQYEDDEMETYEATGHMTPWGVYGRWRDPEKPNKTLGYWCMWHFEGAPVVHFHVAIQQPDGRCVYPKQYPYRAVPGWFEEFERLSDEGKFRERQHGFFDDPPPLPEHVPLPEMDVFGL